MKICKVKAIVVAKPGVVRLQSIENTGRGKTLCYERFLGRPFRDDPDCLRDICEKYIELYRESCEKLDEDPRHASIEVQNWNELYEMIGILPSTVGDNWGLTNDTQWRVNLEFEYELLTNGPLAKKFGEPVYCFGPAEWCEPMERYRDIADMYFYKED